MKNVLIALIALLFATSCVSTEFSAGSPGYDRLELVGGARNYTADELDDADFDGQDVVGAVYSTKREGDLLGAEFGVSYGWKNNVGDGGLDVDTEALEAYTGVVHRGRIGKTPVGYFASAGATLIKLNLDPQGPLESEDDSSFGAYVGGGLEYFATDELSFTLGVRQVMFTDADFNDIDTDFDSTQYTVGLGWSF